MWLRLEGISGGHLVQHPLKPSHPKLVAQDHVQADFEYLWGWRPHNLPGQPELTLTKFPSEAPPVFPVQWGSCGDFPVVCIMLLSLPLQMDCLNSQKFVTEVKKHFLWNTASMAFGMVTLRGKKSKIRWSWGLSDKDSTNIYPQNSYRTILSTPKDSS